MTESRRWVWIFLGLTVGLGAAAAPALVDLMDRDVPIHNYQLARTSEKAAELNAQLGAEGLDSLRMSLWWDLPFLVCFGVLLYLLCVRTARRAAGSGQARLAAAGKLFAALAVTYAVCDAVEDALLFRVADGETDQPWPGLAFGFASVKFLALLGVLAYLLIALLRRGSRSSA